MRRRDLVNVEEASGGSVGEMVRRKKRETGWFMAAELTTQKSRGPSRGRVQNQAIQPQHVLIQQCRPSLATTLITFRHPGLGFWPLEI